MLFDAGCVRRHPWRHTMRGADLYGLSWWLPQCVSLPASFCLMRPLHSAAWERAINGFGIEAPARTGPCFKTPDARGTFLIFRRNLVPRTRAIAPHVRFIGKPGRALSGQSSRSRHSRSRPTIWISRHYSASSFRIFAQTNEPAIRGARRMLADARRWAHSRKVSSLARIMPDQAQQ